MIIVALAMAKMKRAVLGVLQPPVTPHSHTVTPLHPLVPCSSPGWEQGHGAGSSRTSTGLQAHGVTAGHLGKGLGALCPAFGVTGPVLQAHPQRSAGVLLLLCYLPPCYSSFSTFKLTLDVIPLQEPSTDDVTVLSSKRKQRTDPKCMFKKKKKLNKQTKTTLKSSYVFATTAHN